MSTDIKTLLARPQPTCFVCGTENPNGLKIAFQSAADGRITAPWTPDRFCEGLQGIVHGGIVSAVLDEAMAKVVAGMKVQALTCELKVRFRRPVIAGESLTISGWSLARDRRRIQTEATLCDSSGSELAHGWATFLVLAASPPQTSTAEP